MREGEPEWTVRRLSRRKHIHFFLAELPSYQLHHLGVEPPFPGPQPLSWQDVCSYILGPRDVSCSKRQQLPLGPQEDWARQFAKLDVTENPPGDLCRRPPMCCLSGQAHGGPWDLLGNSWEQEIQLTSPDGWCAMRDAGPSTDLDSSVPLGSLPSPWERHLSLAFCDDMKLPARDPGTGTTVSSTLSRHESIAAWPWSCERGCPSVKTLWSWVTTLEV